jgi:hypothetical protein
MNDFDTFRAIHLIACLPPRTTPVAIERAIMKNDMKAIRLFAGITIGTAALAFAASRRGPTVSMHELDWTDCDDAGTRRRYRSPGHLLHHLWELAGLAVPLFEVYVLRALPPAFREQIMIVTAMADECSS